MSEPCWSVYIIRCGDGSLYAGIANNVERRFGEHASQRAEGGKISVRTAAVRLDPGNPPRS